MEKQWLKWAKELQAISQAGIEYSKDKYDIERFQQIRDLSVEIISEYTEMEHHKVKDLFANESGYQTPKVDVRGAIFKGEEILLVKEKLDNKWSMPGGWADVGLSIKENVVKEAMEEAGAEINPRRIIAILDRQKHIKDDFPYSIYKVFVECDYIKGSHIGNIETSEARFFRTDNLPELSIGRNTKKQIDLCFKSRAKDVFETLFD
ncbi:NUDIX hydrolase [Clostridium sp. D2Q-11]|uniref:NUDIX hydrolase n=1 Tax=Anaeromonas frigoriresistens TaxID=2683708 RepID=A0A942UVM8_9FIRM|nr:NUDIX hydrolase [Anaeromonas frigoriresistens]MBS4537649.1 NUDIX hydrolase [Anaeromonas frigoriresistens]